MLKSAPKMFTDRPADTSTEMKPRDMHTAEPKKNPKFRLSEEAVDFIDDEYINGLIAGAEPTTEQVQALIDKSLSKQCLTVEETALLLRCSNPELRQQVQDGARMLKKKVYGNRIVLFAPLYIGNNCINDCGYCGFKRSNKDVNRSTLDDPAIIRQAAALEDAGHKRLILVYGEHPKYDAQFIADSVRCVYGVKSGGCGEIRRVNINAAPMDIEGYKVVKEAGIGTFQIFQETYDHKQYRVHHPENTRKGDYMWRLDGLNRAMEAGIDDVGIGALFGLADWRFDVLGLVTHAHYLQERFGVGPHTISFPRIQEAAGVTVESRYQVNDADFAYLVAVLRLAVPYAGMILTAREPEHIRREVLEFGVSQIDGGTKIEMGGYTKEGKKQNKNNEQFILGDERSLDEIMKQLLEDGYLPSFCTACYRKGRTGEHFMEFAVPGFIKRYCTPNAMTTLQEYLEDYASDETREAGTERIEQELTDMTNEKVKTKVQGYVERIRKEGDRDLLF